MYNKNEVPSTIMPHCPIALDNKIKTLPVVLGSLFVWGLVSVPLYNTLVDNKSAIQRSLKDSVDWVVRDLIVFFARN